MVGSHLLPPNLLRLFAPRPPLPYLKPVGRDPDVPLKSLAKKPPKLSVYETLKLVKEEKEREEQKAFEKGELLDADEEKDKPAGEAAPKEEAKDEEGKEEGEATEVQKKPVVKKDKDEESITTLPVNERIKARKALKLKRHEQGLAEGIKNCTSPP